METEIEEVFDKAEAIDEEHSSNIQDNEKIITSLVSKTEKNKNGVINLEQKFKLLEVQMKKLTETLDCKPLVQFQQAYQN